MSITITGAAGFLGQRLANVLARRGERVVMCDLVEPAVVPANGTFIQGDLEATLEAAITEDTTAVVHLAAVVSSGAELDFDLGYGVNVAGLTKLLERCRSAPARPPTVLFTSSLAVFGATPFATDESPTTPASSYGTQKAIGELLVNDYSRKGFIDGRTLRLPTISVRPGAPNKAASGFASGILREPLRGLRAMCPLDPSAVLWLASPDSAVRALVHGLYVDGDAFGDYRCVNAPGISVSIGDMLASLERHGGDRSLVDFAPDPHVAAIVGSWPSHFDVSKATAMGFPAADDIDAAVASHVERELLGVVG